MLHHPLTPLRCLLERLRWQIQKLVGCCPQPHRRLLGRLGVVVAALHVVTSMRCPPRVGAIRRLFAVTMLYTLGAAMVNQILGANYGFLCHKPEQASLMDSLGSWPWYVGSMILLCVVFYSLLYIPFAITRRRHQAV